MQMTHDDLTSGNLGKKKTYAKIAEHFFWPKIRKRIQHYVDSCTQMCKVKKNYTRAPLQK